MLPLTLGQGYMQSSVMGLRPPFHDMFIDDLQALVDTSGSHARQDHPQLWGRSAPEAPPNVASALRDDALLLRAIGAGLSAEQRGGVPPVVLGKLSLSRQAESLVLEGMEKPHRVMDMARQARSPGHSLLIYTVCGALIGRSAPGRLFIEDLGEALMIPVTLLRAIRPTMPQRNLAA